MTFVFLQKLFIGDNASEMSLWPKTFGAEFAQNFTWPDVLLICAVGSIAVGVLGGLSQPNLKRKVGYQQLGNRGVMLVGLLVLTSRAITVTIADLLGSTLGVVAFYFILIKSHRFKERIQVSDFRGLMWKNRVLGVGTIFVIAILCSLPPSVVFFTKGVLLGELISKQMLAEAILFSFGWLGAGIGWVVVIREIIDAEQDPANFSANTTIRDVVSLSGLIAPTFIFGIFCERLFSLLLKAVAF